MLKAKLVALVCIITCLHLSAQDSIPTPQWRPQYHFSPPKNWTNDPNGLIFLNGEYNLYYQHNPFENKWGHMSWGHAISKNLFHWKNLPVAIPEMIKGDTVISIFSGSAVWDKNNTSGFCKGGKGCLVAIFTGDQPNQKKEAQYIAYSNDGGISFTEYKGNPAIDEPGNNDNFRDPNVFWYAPTKQWIMTVSALFESKIRFYGSKNLREWHLLGSFNANSVARECPSMVPLAVDGNPKHIKWVLMVCAGNARGPYMQYYVGDFNGTTFKSDNPEGDTYLIDYGDSFYAAIPWRNAPGNKTVLIGWLVPGKAETYPWKGQMSIPRDLSLRTTPDGIRLFQNPSASISNSLAKYSHGRVFSANNISINNKVVQLSKKNEFNNNTNWIDAEITLNKASKFGFNIAEKRDANGIVIKKIIVGYNVAKQELYVDCSSSEKDYKNAVNLVQTMPLKAYHNKINLQILQDKSSLEVFVNHGEKVSTTVIYPDADATGLSVFGEGNAVISSLKMWDMNNND